MVMQQAPCAPSSDDRDDVHENAQPDTHEDTTAGDAPTRTPQPDHARNTGDGDPGDTPHIVDPNSKFDPVSKSVRFGIKGRLMIAFGAVALMTVVASGVAWFSFQAVEAEVNNVAGTQVPGMTAALRLTAESASLSAAAPFLNSARSEEERAKHKATLDAKLANMTTYIEDLARHSQDTAAIDDLRNIAQDTAQNLVGLDAAVIERLAARDARQASVQRSVTLHGEILGQIEPLVDDANFELVIGGEDATSSSTQAVETLMSEGVVKLRTVMELEASVNLMIGLLAEATQADSAPKLIAIKDRYDTTQARIEQQLALLPGTPEHAEVGTQIASLLVYGQGEGNVFDLRKELFDLQWSLTSRKQALIDRLAESAVEFGALHEQFLQTTMELTDSANFDLVIQGEDAAKTSADAVQTLMNEGVAKLRGLIELQSQINLAAGLIAAGGTVEDINRIQPLQERTTAAAHVILRSLEALPQESLGSEREALSERIKALMSLGQGDDAVFVQRSNELKILTQTNAILLENLELKDRLGARVNGLVTAAEDGVQAGISDLERAIEKGRVLLLAIAGASLLCAALIAYLYVARNLVARISGLADVMSELAGGNLKVEIPAKGSDEITAMAMTLYVFRNGLAVVEETNARTEEERLKAEARRKEEMSQLADGLEASVKSVVEEVAASSGHMQSSAETMTGTADRTKEQSSVVTSAMEAASSNVQNVAGACEELASSIQEIGRQVGQSSEIARDAATQAEKSNQQVSGLADAAEKIGEVVTVISNIAEQTNLLALNATIEAARAGDAGKGFAVVAGEVKTLANQTAQATEQIGQQVADIQAATGGAVEAIKEIGRTIEKVNEIAGSVATAVEEQNGATIEISRNIQEAASGTSEASHNIVEVNSAAAETGEAAQTVLSAAGGLSSQAENLRGIVDQFLAKVRAA